MEQTQDAVILEETPERKRSRKRKELHENFKGWMFLLPALILLAVFTFYPIINTFFMAFRNGYNSAAANKVPLFSSKLYAGSTTPWGIENFKNAFMDTKFKISLANTFIFAIFEVPLGLLIALLIAVLLKSITKFNKAYQTVLFLPYLTNALAIGSVFMIMFQVQKFGNSDADISWGLINNLLHTKIYWTSTDAPMWAMRTVVIVYGIWSGLPFKILILYGALESVSKQYYDAAKIDGASKWTTLWKVTVPLISPMLAYLFITGLIGGFKIYTSVVGIYGPGMSPAKNGGNFEMGTIVGLIYSYIEESKLGIASAASLILFAIIMVITFINTHFIKKRVHY
jgi:multiple sugar transport system permease protein